MDQQQHQDWLYTGFFSKLITVCPRSSGFSFFIWYCVQLTRFVAILLNWGREEQAAQAVPPPERFFIVRKCGQGE